jgi:hypothetical protein
MCGGSKPKTPKVTSAPVSAPIIPAMEADLAARSSGDEERRKRRMAYGRSDTILTGGLGETGTVRTAAKRLLGQ